MWKTNGWALALVPALAGPWIAIQAGVSHGDDGSKPGGLVRVQPDDAGDGQEGAATFDRDAWRARLEARDLDARQRDFDALVERARRDDGARAAIEAWAKDDQARELAWTSRLLLRELDRGPRAQRGARPFGRGFSAPDFDDLWRQMDDLHRQFGGMDSMFDDLQRRMDTLHRTLPQGALPGGPGVRQSHQSFSLRSGPDGVEVQIEEGEGAERHEQTYKAKSMEELLDAHPELRERIQGGGDDDSFFLGARPRPDASTRPGWSNDDPFQRSARPLKPGAEPDATRLGIQYAQPSADEARALDLDEGQGLRTLAVVPGSLAERLGIRPGDVVVELNGTKLTGPDSVQEVLKARQPGDELRCTVLDAKGAQRKLSYRPKPAPAAPKDGAPKDGGARF